MKTNMHASLSSLVLLVGLWLTGCTKDPSPSLEISGTKSVSFTDGISGMTTTFGLQTNIAWSASVTSGGDWCTLSPSTGTGDALLTVTATGINTTRAVRSATVTVIGSGLTQTITVSQPVQPFDIYAAGDEYTAAGVMPVYWKNNVITRLTQGETGSAQSIVVSGQDIYVLGYMDGTGSTVWKNGTVLYQFPNSTFSSLAVSGSDVYMAGESFIQEGNYGINRVWKNGTVLYERENCVFNALAVSESDVYTAGKGYNSQGVLVATIWKNNTVIFQGNNALGDFYPGQFVSSISALCLSGSDVYAAGEEWEGVTQLGKVWKNGTPLSRSINASFYSICTSGTDFYVCGWGRDDNGLGYSVGLWKNGSRAGLNTTLPNYGTNMVCEAGGDIYVAGGQYDQNGTGYATVWKNATGTGLISTENGLANGIFLAPRP